MGVVPDEQRYASGSSRNGIRRNRDHQIKALCRYSEKGALGERQDYLSGDGLRARGDHL